MIKKLEQMKSQAPILVPKHSITGSRASQRSSIQSINSISMCSTHTADNQNPKPTRSSMINSQKLKPKFQQLKQNYPSPTDLIQQKMQNVSCLYSNFIFKNSKKNFIDQVKLQRYRIMLENQRIQKNQLQKDFQQLKAKLAQSEKQKSTIMFAYRTLEQKIKEREKQVKLKIRHLNNVSVSHSKNQKLSVNQDDHRGSMTSVFMETQLLKSRHMLTSQGIPNFNDDEKDSQGNLAQRFNRMCSSKQIGKTFQKSYGIKQWQEKIKKFQQMQKEINQLRQMKPKLYWLQLTNKQLNQQKDQLISQLQKQQSQHKKAISQLCECKMTIQKLRNQITQLTSEISTLSQTCGKYKAKCQQHQRQDERKRSIIQDLENTKYSYLMKQQKEKQQIQVLKKFTQNLQLNDQKINQFIQVTFDNKVQTQVNSQNKLFKQDISYILHLIKKKQNIYSELITEYQEKHRQTQTRSFLLQKILHLTDNFIKKLDQFLEQQIILCEGLRNAQNTQSMTNSKKVQANAPSAYLSLNKFIQTLQALIENYHLDKRII